MFHGLLQGPGCHETKMTFRKLHNFGAYTTRQGAASLGRIKPLGSVSWLACVVDALMAGVITHPRGGRTP